VVRGDTAYRIGSPLRENDGVLIISPGVQQALRPAGGDFPFSFGRQALMGPLAVSGCLIPGYADNRVSLLAGGQLAIRPACGRLLAGFGHEFSVAGVRYFKLIDPKLLELDLMGDRIFVPRPIPADQVDSIADGDHSLSRRKLYFTGQNDRAGKAPDHEEKAKGDD
jgi:hypothetical protein